jgi:hypothetical protein
MVVSLVFGDDWGYVLLFWGLNPPVSACTITEPSDLIMISLKASGSRASRRPV